MQGKSRRRWHIEYRLTVGETDKFEKNVRHHIKHTGLFGGKTLYCLVTAGIVLRPYYRQPSSILHQFEFFQESHCIALRVDAR